MVLAKYGSLEYIQEIETNRDRILKYVQDLQTQSEPETNIVKSLVDATRAAREQYELNALEFIKTHDLVSTIVANMFAEALKSAEQGFSNYTGIIDRIAYPTNMVGYEPTVFLETLRNEISNGVQGLNIVDFILDLDDLNYHLGNENEVRVHVSVNW